MQRRPIGDQPAAQPEAFAPNVLLQWLAAPQRWRHRRRDGALVFLDVSGFTALTEALSQEGRVGAERIRDVIDATFDTLLRLAYEDGGSLLSFGGDAVLLLFEGDGAVVRAASSARRMLDALLDRGPIVTPRGEVLLGATVGVHAGPVDLLVLGERHHALFVVGPTASDTVALEGRAPADGVLVSDGVADQLPAELLGPREEHDGLGARPLISAVPVDTRPGPPARPPSDRDPWSLVPEALRDALRAGRVDGEHRRASVAFVRIRGTDGLLASAGGEALADELGRVVEAALEACHRFGVTWLSSDVDIDGVKVILVAGVPTGDEDDDDRLVMAARAVAAVDTRLDVHVGVHRGPLFSGLIGPEHRRTYTVLGDAVNLAARTVGKAGPGQVLATIEVLNGLRTHYDVEFLEPFTVKGKALEVQAALVGDEIGVRVRRRVGRTAFVGRHLELARLVEAVDSAASTGRGATVSVDGPAGVGKSRLLDELSDVRSSMPIHLVACTRFSIDRPFRTITMLLRLVLTGQRHGNDRAIIDAAQRMLGDEPEAELLPLLGRVIGVELPATPASRAIQPDEVQDRVREVIGRLLALALPGPCVIVFEDVQWIDAETRSMLEDAARRLVSERPWTFVLTSRAPHDLDVDGPRLTLGPLPDEDATTLALALVDAGTLPIERVGQLVERAGGLPLYLEELAAAAGSGELPDDVESLVRQQLDALPPPALRLVRHAAVLGIEFPPELLDEALAHDPGTADASLQDVADLLVPQRTGYLRFRQSIHQEVAYEGMPWRARRELHRRAAAALAARADAGDQVSVEARSRHHHLAEEWAASWRWSRAAMEEAAARSAHATAARFGRRALEAGERLRVPTEERAATWELLGDALEVTSAYQQAREAYTRARRLRRPSPRLARKMGDVREKQGAFGQAARWYRTARDELPEDDLAGRLRIEERTILLTLRRGDPAGALAMAREALRRARGLDDDDLLGHLHHLTAWAAGLVGDDDAPEHVAAARACFERTGDLRGLVLVENEHGLSSYYRGAWDEAIAAYHRNRERLRRLGDLGHAAATDGNIGEVLGDQGHIEQAIEVLTQARDWLEAARIEIFRIDIELCLARALGRSGAFEAGVAAGRRGLEVARATGTLDLERAAHARLAELAAFVGDADGAAAHLTDARRIASSGSAWNAAVEARLDALVLWLRGVRDEAIAGLAAAAEVAAAQDVTYEQGLSLAAAGHLGGDAAAASRADELLAPLGLVLPPAELALGPRLGRRRGSRPRPPQVAEAGSDAGVADR